MQDVLMALLVLCFLAIGFLPMKLIDRFLEQNQKNVQQEDQVCEPSYIVLTEELTDEEVTAEIRCYRKKHRHAKILLYENMKKTCSRLFLFFVL